MSRFLFCETSDPDVALMYPQGFDIYQWLTKPESTPDDAYLQSTPVNLPLTGLTQLMQVMVLYKTLGVTPGKLADCFKAMVGQSQGIVMAAAFSSFTDEESFYRIGRKTLGILLLASSFAQMSHPLTRLADGFHNIGPSVDDVPRPMLAVKGTTESQLVDLILQFNNLQKTAQHRKVGLAAVHSADQFVVSGHTLAIAKFCNFLNSETASSSRGQLHGGLAQELPQIAAHFTNISVPYHNALLADAVGRMVDAAHKRGWLLDGSAMRVVVRAGDDGHDIRLEPDTTAYLFKSMCVLSVNWPQAVYCPGITHVVDFGPGGYSGIGRITYGNLHGSGVFVACFGELMAQMAMPSLGFKAHIYQPDLLQLEAGPNWLSDFGPQLVRTSYNGKLHINTNMHQNYGLPPVMVSSIAPDIHGDELFAAISSAGYHVEVAFGKVSKESVLVDRLRTLAELLRPGQGITLSCSFADQHQWGIQLSALLQLRAEGLPITGISISDDVPPVESAAPIIESLSSAGIRHISFKPDSIDKILWVVAIARRFPNYPIGLQWIATRAGGHHSAANFHTPVIDTYASIRMCANIVLVAGFGFGSASEALPYITGNWSVPLGRLPMSFDGVVLDSCIMVAKEVNTARNIKELSLSAPALPNIYWGNGTAGMLKGVYLPIANEYGAIECFVNNRAADFLWFVHSTILTKPLDKQPELLLNHKEQIIARLNSDYMRPWFGRKSDRRVVDLGDMTYAEVIDRLVELLYLGQQRRWIDKSFHKFTTDFIARTERRLMLADKIREDSVMCNIAIACPTEYADIIVNVYPVASKQLLASEDIQYFISCYKQGTQRAMPFIAVLDADFGRLLVQDAAWQSDLLSTVADQDSERLVIRRDVSAVDYPFKVDEPIGDILDGVYHGMINGLLDMQYGGDESKVPLVDGLLAPLSTTTQLPSTIVVDSNDGSARTFHLPSNLDGLSLDIELWASALAGSSRNNWLYALMTTPFIAQGASKSTGNFMRRVMLPQAGQTVTVGLRPDASAYSPIKVVVTRDNGSAPEVSVEYSDRLGEIVVCIYNPTLVGSATLCLSFSYHPDSILLPIRHNAQEFADRVRQFYQDTWFSCSDKHVDFVDVESFDIPIRASGVTITEEHIHAYCGLVGANAHRYMCQDKNGLQFAPIDFVQLSVTPSALRYVSSSAFGSGQLEMVHLSNRVKLVDGFTSLKVGDSIWGSLAIDRVTNTPAGKLITLTGQTYIDSTHIASVEATLLSRKHHVDASQIFWRPVERTYDIIISTAEELAALISKEWFIYHDNVHLELPAQEQHQYQYQHPHLRLQFCLVSDYAFKSDRVMGSISTNGKVFLLQPRKASIHVGDVSFEWCEAVADPVVEYLTRNAAPSKEVLFEDGGYHIYPTSNAEAHVVTAPHNINTCAYMLGDYNPIHVNKYVANIAGLQDTVTHGIWTSAVTRSAIEVYATEGAVDRIRDYRIDLLDMALPGDQLRTELQHVGMVDGRMLIQGQTVKVSTGLPVLACKAEVEQPATAYVFTGQGSQTVGMGMELYTKSAAARNIWDRANQHMFTTYGVSLLDIVRNNPKELTVYFGGDAGKTVLENYMALKRKVLSKNGDISTVPIFPDINCKSFSYSYSSPTGLLNATQFTQVALVIHSLAAIDDMRSHGLVQSGAAFAGHSLGEYSALVSLGHILTLEDLIDVVFYRGLAMRSVVEHKEQSSAQYGMVAVNPSRIGGWFDGKMLARVITAIVRCSNQQLLEIVNYNVSGQQYVAAGTLAQLSALRQVLDRIVDAVNVPLSDSTASGDIEALVDSTVAYVMAGQINSAPIRGKATIPLEGIDMPFHSSLLLSGVAGFKDMLAIKIHAEDVDYSLLCGNYIPNLTGVPFEISRQYFEMVYMITGSSTIAGVLDNWPESTIQSGGDGELAKLATILLVELLAYQFASPVRWVDTQNVLFNSIGVRRFIEVGTSPILCGMAAKTLADMEHSPDQSVMLMHIEQDRDAVYYTHRREEAPAKLENEATATARESIDLAVDKLKAENDINGPAMLQSQTQPADPADIGSVSETAQIVDVPLTAFSIIQAMVAYRTKQPITNITAGNTIKALVSGKSTLQNEIIGDLHKEFGKHVPEKAEEQPLNDIAATIDPHLGDEGGLGKHTQSLVSRLFTSKMPGGFTLNSARSFLQSTYGLGPQRQDGLLLVAVTIELPKRLADESGAREWLARVAKIYASMAGISYSKAAVSTSTNSASRTALSSVTTPLMSHAAMKQMEQKERENVMRQIEVLAQRIGVDLREGARAANALAAKATENQVKLDMIYTEFGEELIDGAHSCFDVRKVRRFDSYWNWIRQQAFECIQQAINNGDSKSHPASDHVDAHLLQRLFNCANPELVQMLSGIATVLEKSNDPSLCSAHALVESMLSKCLDGLNQSPVYIELSTPVGPQTSILPDGTVRYEEVPRKDEKSFAEYVRHMREPANAVKSLDASMQQPELQVDPPFIHIRQRQLNAGSDGGNRGNVGSMREWSYSPRLTDIYFNAFNDMCSSGLSYSGKTALVTGCGKGSIGSQIVSGLLAGGARVVATTNSFSRQTATFFEELYRTNGARGSELILVPFNQGSTADIAGLVDYIYSNQGESSGLGLDLDYIFPFAAVSDVGSTVTSLGSRSEFSLRVMLTNTLRLLGAIKSAKEQREYVFRPTLVILPLSPNHGIFGGDGLYGECKLALETLFNRWQSESWSPYLSVAGAVIGWTRGTGMMLDNNRISQDMEGQNARTFSTREMAFNILGLLCPDICHKAQKDPIWVDLTAGMDNLENLSLISRDIRNSITQHSHILQGVLRESITDGAATFPALSRLDSSFGSPTRLANHTLHFPTPSPSYQHLPKMSELRGMVNLDKVAVITGYGEVGPYGSSETRWEMEAHGELSVEGYIELAWIMGLIKHWNGELANNGQHYIGWVDSKTEKPVADVDIKPRYEEYIRAHTGTRLIEAELALGYNPHKKHIMREVQIEHNMPPFEASEEVARAYKSANGDKVDVWANLGKHDSWSVRFLKGALIRVPAAVEAECLVGAQIPTGWSPTRYGIPEDLAKQIDPTTCYSLVATVEALIRSGITDPYELYQYLHVSEVGNTTGSTVGGIKSFQDMFRHRQQDMDVNSDVMQESFISSIQAWTNMLLMSGSGPVKPVAGACATVAVSIDAAVESIQTGKAQFMIAGGVEDFTEEVSTEFANMGATCKTADEFASGREPSDMCRPCTSTRTGIVEGQGAGTVTLMSASAALRMGVPIYGIVAMTATATDKQGRSVPAPGKGLLTTACESKRPGASRCVMSAEFRRRQFNHHVAALDAWKQNEIDALATDGGIPEGEPNIATGWDVQHIEHMYKRQLCALKDTWGGEFWKQDPSISPLRGSLAVWGLTPDDIGFASFHGTSTVANDQNEAEVLDAKLKNIGRTRGCVLPVVCQKWLTGHPKAAAGSFALNGIIQSMRTGLIPGNRNADNIDIKMRKLDHILLLSKTVKVPKVKAALLTSFGFGQVGSELLIVHPDYILSVLEPKQLEEYNSKLVNRQQRAYRYWQDVLVGNHTFVQVKTEAPYDDEQEYVVKLDPTARARYNTKTNKYTFEMKSHKAYN
ncbi:fatty acid synthase alpha subunit Lsd1 [Coemansia sp. Benny D115]|nr:fatty acid synthase alpha subunit Lsd1 [Coemansia sp. Benny D115]